MPACGYPSILFSLKMPGFLASMVCSSSGASPSGSSLPRLSFSSLEKTNKILLQQQQQQQHIRVM